MTIEIVPAVEADCRRFAQLDKAAFGASSSEGDIQRILFPPSSAVEEDAPTARRAALMAKIMREDPSAHFIKAVDTELSCEEAIVGFAKWHVWTDGMPPSPQRQWGVGCNAEACGKFFGGMDKLKERVMMGKSCVYLQPLITHPDYQRQGIGTRMVQWGLDEAARLNLPAFLLSSSDGLSLYQKCGFVVVDETETDFTPFGVPKVICSRAMIRKV
ncbi:uncharacterized protein CTRU02_213969 [Colletotrichum truncatum]|uniref:Uncharacterized protein n=1 Tax=Colletotrichum truncatum TaxID=5467 RepID=A0ACC3YH56_COLTU|nr:uncharacterized protein CTRU02_06282 [Colletotrichum truncatum]KAF6792786.1 hypothetical protein CTRU02_06282 [Colletotrichum truncatum]